MSPIGFWGFEPSDAGTTPDIRTILFPAAYNVCVEGSRGTLEFEHVCRSALRLRTAAHIFAPRLHHRDAARQMVSAHFASAVCLRGAGADGVPERAL